MRGRFVRAAVVASAGAAIAFSGVATAGGGARTTVTIQGGGSVSGYVKSSKLKCKNERKVKVYRKVGAVGGGDDQKIGSDTSSPNGTRYQWSIGNPGATGKIYAKTGSKPGCRNDTSKVIPASG